jgi:hypothetical protein
MKTREEVERVFQPWLQWSHIEEVLSLGGLVTQELFRRGVRRVKVDCAWCLKDGKSEAEALIGEREPHGETLTSHGLCGAHRKAVEEEIEAIRRKISAETLALREKVDP